MIKKLLYIILFLLITYTSNARDLNLGWDNKITHISYTKTFLITASEQDAEEKITSGNTTSLNSSDLELNYASDGNHEQIVGLWFGNIDIPQGAIITEAKIVFYCDETDSTSISVNIYGENNSNPNTFTATTDNIKNRTLTSNYVLWDNIEIWDTIHKAYYSPNISNIIQEIINRSDWNSGNAIVLIIKHTTGTSRRVAESWDGENNFAAKLIITYID